MDSLLWNLLGYVVFPLWLLSGMADYAVHRRTSIETTSGTHESLLHLLQTAEIAGPALLLLFLEVNALVLLLMALGVAAHTWTAWRDLRYANTLREITPFEQFVHAAMDFGFSGSRLLGSYAQAEGDILEYRHMAEQGVVLEDEADLAFAHAAHGRFLAVEADGAGVG